MPQTTLCEIANPYRCHESGYPYRHAKTPRTMRPKRPCQQCAQAPKEIVALAWVNARREKAQTEVRVQNADAFFFQEIPNSLRNGLFRAQSFKPAAQDQRHGGQWNRLPRAERLRRHKQNENHRQPSEPGRHRFRAGHTSVTLIVEVW